MLRLLLPIVLVAGCAGSGEGLDVNGRPLGENTAKRGTLGWLQENLFTPICTQCHVAAGAPQGLSLDPDNAYRLLVNKLSIEQPDINRVKPKEPENSYIIIKVLANDPRRLGERMPRNGPYLSESQIEGIRRWITAGANQD